MMEKEIEAIVPFLFQKEIKPNACEDAKPIATTQYAIVCDGLGGSGFTKHKIPEGTEGFTIKTSAYVGSRIVSACVEKFYQEHWEALAASDQDIAEIGKSVESLKGNLEATIQSYVEELQVTLPQSKTIKIFPTTLASAYYLPCGNKLTVVGIWAGDSRIYVLTPSKGLQLLSLDDADGAANSMNSGTVMTNCIYAGSFYLNYCVYTLEEPGIVFCCSDGCFDYLPSPLNMEWLLLNAILSAPSNDAEGFWGEVLEESIRDGIYETIKDDTTMAGICFQFDSLVSLQKAFQPRMEAFGPKAIQMNEYITKKKTTQDELNNAQKVYHLNENKVTDILQKVVRRTLSTQEPVAFYESLMRLTAFSEYEQFKEDEVQRIKSESKSEERALCRAITESKERCRTLFMLDYMAERDIQQNRSRLRRNKTPGWSSKTISFGESTFDFQAFNKVIDTLIEMVKRKELYDIFPAIDSIIQDGLMDALAQIREKQNQNGRDRNFDMLLKQAYYSTDQFSEQREALEKDYQFQNAWNALRECRKPYPYCSRMTGNAMQEVYAAIDNHKKYVERMKKEKNERLLELANQYYMKQKKKIQEEILGKTTQELRELFRDSGIAIEQLIQVADAWKVLRQNEKANQIADAESRIQELWTEYRKEYELFKQVERGST